MHFTVKNASFEGENELSYEAPVPLVVTGIFGMTKPLGMEGIPTRTQSCYKFFCFIVGFYWHGPSKDGILAKIAVKISSPPTMENNEFHFPCPEVTIDIAAHSFLLGTGNFFRCKPGQAVSFGEGIYIYTQSC